MTQTGYVDAHHDAAEEITSAYGNGMMMAIMKGPPLHPAPLGYFVGGQVRDLRDWLT